MSRRRGNRSRNRGRQRQSSGSGVFDNRRKPGSNWITPADIIRNIKERFYCFVNRVPAGARLRWKDGKIVGHYSAAPRPWFS